MNRTDDRLLPVLLLCAQAVVWPGAALVRGAVPPASSLLVTALVAGVVTAALTLRRIRPVATLVVVAAACALGAGPLPAGAMAVLGTAGVALALFTVAAERDAFTAVLCVVALAAWQLLQGISLHGLSDRNGLDLVLTAVLYAAACGAGLLVRRTRRSRQAAERLLKRAESERHRLPAAERRRMERELHDVSAHHLTAVVVTVGAALGLRERRPELAEEALEFAVETGREVTRALGAVRAPAPSREDVPSPRERLLDLVAGFRRLDQQVDCAVDPLPDGAVADAVYGIVRGADQRGTARPRCAHEGAGPVRRHRHRGRGHERGTADRCDGARCRARRRSRPGLSEVAGTGGGRHPHHRPDGGRRVGGARVPARPDRRPGGWALVVTAGDGSGESMAGVIPLLATAPASLVLLVLPGGAVLFVAAVVLGALVNALIIGWCARALRRGGRPDPTA